jgi:hypothetical protein
MLKKRRVGYEKVPQQGGRLREAIVGTTNQPGARRLHERAYSDTNARQRQDGLEAIDSEGTPVRSLLVMDAQRQAARPV